MRHLIAITRAVSPAIANCELTHLPRVSIDHATASRQHAEYERQLELLGCMVQRIGADPELPDSVFVEDAAVVLDEIAIIAHPGAASRRPEVPAIIEALSPHRCLARIEPPGTLDGGDVIVAGRTIFVGRSSRTNDYAITQLRSAAAPYGYDVRAILVEACLHLKSAVTAANERTLLINRAWVAAEAFDGFELVDVDPAEPAAANVVRIDDHLLSSAGFPRTRERLERRGFQVRAVDVSELAKAEGAVTCCSLIFTSDSPVPH